MKYFVITTKHHDGFCLWDSKLTDYKATQHALRQGPARGRWSRPSAAEGLQVGFYHSLIDWHHPEYTVDMLHPLRDDRGLRANGHGPRHRQVRRVPARPGRELLTELRQDRHPVPRLLLPRPRTARAAKDWQSEQLLTMIRELQPGIIINDRLDLLDVRRLGLPDARAVHAARVGHASTASPWSGRPARPSPAPGATTATRSTWKRVGQLVADAHRHGQQGRQPAAQRRPDRPRGVRRPGPRPARAASASGCAGTAASIYGCTQAPAEFPEPANCRLTYNPKTGRLYVHVLAWPFGHLPLDGFAGKVEYAQLLHDASEVAFTEKGGETGFMPGSRGSRRENTLTLRLPVVKPDVEVPVIELFLKGH